MSQIRLPVQYAPTTEITTIPGYIMDGEIVATFPHIPANGKFIINKIKLPTNMLAITAQTKSALF